MYTQGSSCSTIREKKLAGYNLVWNSKSGEVHSTGARCHSSDHLDRMALEHEHFFVGYYAWDGTKWQLYLGRWDPETAGPAAFNYSNCAFCKPETTARQ